MKQVFIFIYTILLVSVAGCAPKIFEGLEYKTKESILKENLYPFFSPVDSVYVFDMQISYKENDYAGTLIVKHVDNTMARAVFTSVFGITIFDFELSEADFKVNRCVEPMQKKVVLNLFRKDFRTLLLYGVSASFKAKIYQGSNNVIGYKVKTSNGLTYFLTDTEHKELQKIQTPGCFTLLQVNCSDFDKHFPQHISISHPRIKLYMELKWQGE